MKWRGSPSQFADVLKAFAWALTRKGVTSAGYSQVIPSQPIENQVLNKNRHRTETTWAALFPLFSMSYKPAKTAIVTAWNAAIHSMRGRRPARSMMKMAMILVMKYVVPFTPEMIRLNSASRPIPDKTEVR